MGGCSRVTPRRPYGTVWTAEAPTECSASKRCVLPHLGHARRRHAHEARGTRRHRRNATCTGAGHVTSTRDAQPQDAHPAALLEAPRPRPDPRGDSDPQGASRGAARATGAARGAAGPATTTDGTTQPASAAHAATGPAPPTSRAARRATTGVVRSRRWQAAPRQTGAIAQRSLRYCSSAASAGLLSGRSLRNRSSVWIAPKR